MRRITLDERALQDLTYWSQNNLKMLKRIFELFDNMAGTPFTGIGKPEALRENLKGYWSRRIDEEHRIVYRVTDDAIVIIACKEHYKNL